MANRHIKDLAYKVFWLMVRTQLAEALMNGTTMNGTSKETTRETTKGTTKGTTRETSRGATIEHETNSKLKQAELEDRIYLKIDKLIALCSAQALLDLGENPPDIKNRCSLSLLIEEQALELRQLLDDHFRDH